MCGMARQLLAEKLIDDFYEEHLQSNASLGEEPDVLGEKLKAALSKDKHVLLLQWEAQCAENCGTEIRDFANFVAHLMLDGINAECALEDKVGSGA
ncbi:hypothetical protein [Ferroacidibacillus organovorans]|uniref:Uncharacterized protein n=1 Tax=Ferroacidibacillus organovorans TaxID=1765683 RepID=A0A853KC22_9BACL|nr:hypothetical protein [Ferroacidibacillus organovorans]KYP79877.1 hypothetical protein AYJ22_02980 [Ferroacidibacillus organovorans]OAG94645.1 hypothetical protein AYW79_04635 [Ferroacidibacillus organovorans]